MTWAAIAVAGAAVIGAVVQSDSSRKARHAQSDAQKQAEKLQREQMGLSTNMTANYRFVGDQALNQLAQLFGFAPYASANDPRVIAMQAKQQKALDIYTSQYAKYVNQYNLAHPPKKKKKKSGLGGALGGLVGGSIGATAGALLGGDRTQSILDPAGLFGGDPLFGKKKEDMSQAELYALSKLGEPPKISSLEEIQQQISSQGGLKDGKDGANKAFESFRDSTGYQFRLNQGTRSVERSAAARGLLNSGAALKAVSDYGQNTASNEFGNYFNQLATMAGIGERATGQQLQAGQYFANQQSQNMINAGNLRASGYLQQGQQYQDLLNAGAYAWGQYNQGQQNINPNTGNPYQTGWV